MRAFYGRLIVSASACVSMIFSGSAFADTKTTTSTSSSTANAIEGAIDSDGLPAVLATILDTIQAYAPVDAGKVDVWKKHSRELLSVEVTSQVVGLTMTKMVCTPNMQRSLFDFALGAYQISRAVQDIRAKGASAPASLDLADAFQTSSLGMFNVLKCIVENPDNPASKRILAMVSKIGINLGDEMGRSAPLGKYLDALGHAIQMARGAEAIGQGARILFAVSHDRSGDVLVISDKMLDGMIDLGIGYSYVLEGMGAKGASVPRVMFQIASKIHKMNIDIPKLTPWLRKKYTENARFNTCQNFGPDYYRWMQLAERSGSMPADLKANIEECMTAVSAHFGVFSENDARASALLPFSAMVYCKQYTTDSAHSCVHLRSMMTASGL